MKLSKAQQLVMDDAKKSINEARTLSFEAWWDKHGNGRIESLASYRDMYKEHRAGVAYIWANTRTIKSLEALGLIEIVKLRGTLDEIKVLNY